MYFNDTPTTEISHNLNTLALHDALPIYGSSGDADLQAVRSRAGATPVDLPATLDNILAERMRELAWEGHRRQDMVRFGTFIDAYTDRPQLPGESNGYTTVFPIESRILNLNPMLVQNPGY